MATLDAYLFFDGTCADAMRFYEHVFGGKLEMMMTYGEAPVSNERPPEKHQDRIMHARLVIDGRALLASDVPGGEPYKGQHGFALAINYPAVGQARRVFDALAAGGNVTMPMQKTFWAESFGMLVDRFGTSWMVNVDAPAG
jgi:PhnB protein